MITIRPALPTEIDTLSAIDEDATTLYAEHGLRIEMALDHVFVRNELARPHAAGGSAIWLTTYAHVPFNRPYYEQRGFIVAHSNH